MRLICVRAAATAYCLMLALSARAAEPPLPSLSLSGAVGRALQHRPELAGFAFELRIQDAKRTEAGLRPAPQLEVLVEDAAGTGQRSGIASAQTSLLLSQVLELGGKREGRQAIVDAELGRAKTEQSARQLDVVAEVARRFVAVLQGQSRLTLAIEGVTIAERSRSLVAERVQASRSPPAEAARAGVQLGEARLAFEDAEHELEIARRFLAAAMGEADVRFGTAEGELLALPPPSSFEALLGRLPATPDLLRFADEERVRDAELRLSELRRRADVSVTLGARRYEQGDDVALVAGITVPLFAARNAQPRVDAARAARERVGTEREALLLMLQAQLFSQYTQLQYELGLSRVLREELLPGMQQALDESARAYERGRYSYLEWTVAQRELVEGRLRLIESAGRFHVLRIEIERLTGESLTPVGAVP